MNQNSPAEGPAATSTDIDPTSLVRRALVASALELDQALSTVTPGDRRRQKALDRWFAGFAAQVRRHHEVLDSIVVPTLTARGALSDGQLDTLADDHSWIDDLLSDLGDALGVLSFGLGAEAWWLGKASDLAATLSHILRAQLQREEALMSELLAQHLDDGEREIVHQETVRAVAGGPTSFSLPWLHAHVTDEERVALDRYTSTAGRLVGLTCRGAYVRTALSALG